MKRILINFVTLGRNGIDIPRLSKFKAFDSLGCELDLFSGTFIRRINLADKDVYTFNETIPELKSYPEIKWTKMKFMFYSLKMNVRGLFFVRRILRSHYDVIYSPASVLDLVIIPYIIKLFDKKIIWTSVLDNVVPFTDSGNKFTRFLAWLFFRISLCLLRKADVIFVVSEELREFLLKSGFLEKKIVLSGNGVENDLIKIAKAESQYDIDALFMGRINETKGIFDMLKVLGLVKKKYPCFQLAVLGEGDENTEKKFEKKARQMNLWDNVQFLGFKIGLEKFNIIKSSKCFWFLSMKESFGVALLEAVCSGIPAFAYDLPQFAWLYSNGEVNISPIGDYQSVARKVLELFESGNFRNEKGEKLLGKYSWEKIAETEYGEIQKILR